jgi:hypothetical protein
MLLLLIGLILFGMINLIVWYFWYLMRNSFGEPFGEPPCLKFLRGLAAQHEPYIRFDTYSYYCKYTLVFPDVDVRLEWDDIRKGWKLDIRDKVSSEAIYGYYVNFCAPPKVTVDFLLERYNLKPKIDEMIAARHAKQVEGNKRVTELRKRYGE